MAQVFMLPGAKPGESDTPIPEKFQHLPREALVFVPATPKRKAHWRRNAAWFKRHAPSIARPKVEAPSVAPHWFAEGAPDGFTRVMTAITLVAGAVMAIAAIF